MISGVYFRQAEFKPGSDVQDARNVVKPMEFSIRLDRRGIADLIAALAACIDGASAASMPSHHGTINIEVDRSKQ